jgi:hypothetical protein
MHVVLFILRVPPTIKLYDNFLLFLSFLKAMTWFHGAFPHPLAPSRKGRGDFLEPLKKNVQIPDNGPASL